MWMLGPVGFTAPWLLLGLIGLPILWFLLRAVPPAPIRRRFPGVVLLLGLRDEDAQAERTPWWLLALRMLALAAAIIGFAGPVLNPEVRAAGEGPLLIVADASWASARDWSRRQDRMEQALVEAQNAGRPVAIVRLSAPPAVQMKFGDPADLRQQVKGLSPRPWEPDATDLELLPEGRFDSLWLSDGMERPSRAALLAALQERGAVSVWQPAAPVLALGAPVIREGALALPVLATRAPLAPPEVVAIGLDPTGLERELARMAVVFDGTLAEARFDLPPELRNRITRFEISGQRSAGAVSLTDDAVKRRKVALVAGGPPREGLELLSPLHYLREALRPSSDLIEASLEDVLLAKPDVIILADVSELADPDRLAEWVEEGGLLVRFAGPLMAAGTAQDDYLLPVRLRVGGRSVGGTMSWESPRALAPFPEGSPFAGLAAPDDVTVAMQVMAEPSPELAERTIAALADGTPLVTRAAFGAGDLVFFHVSANAEWSSLPLSGLFPAMLERLAISTSTGPAVAEEMAGTTWVPQQLIDAFGRLEGAEKAAGVAGEDLAGALPGPDLPPGLYASDERVIALNALARDRVLAPARWPASVPLEGNEAPRQMPLKGALLAAALGVLLLDAIATLMLSGQLVMRRATGVAALALMLAGFGTDRAQADGMEEARAIAAASDVVLAHVATGDAEVDRIALAGLRGLSGTVSRRTAVEPAQPMTLDLETDDLALFSLIYWPVTEDQPAPSARAYLKLNRYLRGGGMILFDTRDADLAGFGGATAAGRRLQALAAPLDIPPLDPIPPDHVLTRAFYLLQEFPGRYNGPIWVEAAPPDAELAEGMPFRNLNDGVTPVVIGGNDWAAAWAQDEQGMPMFPVGRGLTGERQREIAMRFGVNLVMHVLTGNYKSDQVHVPALLERLGQ